MPTTSPAPKNLPLPVRVFHAAMEQQLSLADYAQSIGISSDSLQAILTAPLNHVESAILDQLADIYQQPHETLRDHVSIAPPQESFAAWLKRNMEGISQHALRTRAQLDAQTLKRFLNAGLLPDSDQAERLARALYIDRMEFARVVTANMVHQADSVRPTATTRTSGDQHTPSPASITESMTTRSGRTRRQKAIPDTDALSPQGAAASGAPLGSVRKGEHPQHTVTRRQGDTKTIDTVGEPETAREDDQAARSATRTRVGTKSATPRSAPAAARPMDPNRSSDALDVEHPPPRSAQRRTTPTTAIPAIVPTTESAIDPMPKPVVKQPRLRAARRQADTTARDRETITTCRAGALTAQDNPTMTVSESVAVPASDAPYQHTIRKQRRTGSVSTQGAADVAEPALIARVTEVPTSGGAGKCDRTAETALSVAAVPAALVQPAELAREMDGVVPRTTPTDVHTGSIATSNSPALTIAPTTPEDTQRSQNQTANITAAPERVAVASVLAADTATLELTPDEVRLIRHWRQLHPHGRRATLHYIGSLLVDE